jgi:uncharacterized protein YoxC
MATQPIDIDALVQLLQDNPEARQRLLAALLPQEFLALPFQVAQLARTVAEHNERIERLERVVQQLADTVAQLVSVVQSIVQELAELRETVNGLIRGQEELRASVAELRETMEGLAKAVERLIEWQVLAEQRFQRIEDRLGQLIGWRLEEEYAKHAYAYFGSYLRKIRRADMEEIFDKAIQKLSFTEVKDLSRADLILQGQLRFADQRVVYLVMEVAATLDVNDVTRASRRADLLSRAGFPCIPVVGGEKMTPEVEDSARQLDVAIALDGGLMGWEAAFQKRLKMTSPE